MCILATNGAPHTLFLFCVCYCHLFSTYFTAKKCRVDEHWVLGLSPFCDAWLRFLGCRKAQSGCHSALFVTTTWFQFEENCFLFPLSDSTLVLPKRHASNLTGSLNCRGFLKAQSKHGEQKKVGSKATPPQWHQRVDTRPPPPLPLLLSGFLLPSLCLPAAGCPCVPACPCIV